ncbi:hypothetical protein OPV09_17575 [Janthinobacterium sp. TB1-E2]|uniref:Uncharacterized protein n=1 Tax=Janthinobacterium aestuarii TaxID=2985511 RepID=A0ABZ2GHJ4_9BURK
MTITAASPAQTNLNNEAAGLALQQLQLAHEVLVKFRSNAGPHGKDEVIAVAQIIATNYAGRVGIKANA